MTVIRVTNEGRPKIKQTVEGGLAIRLTNKTGANSVKGSLVQTSTTVDYAFELTGVDDFAPVGVVYESGIADGSECWIVIAGIADVLLKDATASVRGNWVKTADANGRADATNAAPPGGTINALEEHLREIGHCLESKGSGTDVLARCLIHFN